MKVLCCNKCGVSTEQAPAVFWPAFALLYRTYHAGDCCPGCAAGELVETNHAGGAP